jgi:hypothetical protein
MRFLEENLRTNSELSLQVNRKKHYFYNFTTNIVEFNHLISLFKLFKMRNWIFPRFSFKSFFINYFDDKKFNLKRCRLIKWRRKFFNTKRPMRSLSIAATNKMTRIRKRELRCKSKEREDSQWCYLPKLRW